MKHPRVLLLVLAIQGLVGCAGSQAEPQLPSSAGQTSYAQDYPSLLQALANAQANAETEVKNQTAEFSKYPDQLRDPAWEHVLEVVEAADTAGRAAGYAERQRDAERVLEFFSTEREDITRRVAGSVNYVAKKKNYDFDAYGPVSGSLKDSVDKQLEKRLREANDAHLVIDRNRESLGRGNLNTLEKQADIITFVSYLTHAGLPHVRARAEALMKEADQVKSTLDKAIADEQAIQSEQGRNAAEKRASADRLNRYRESRQRLDSATTQAQNLKKDIEQRNRAAQKEYDDALDELKKAIRDRASRSKK